MWVGQAAKSIGISAVAGMCLSALVGSAEAEEPARTAKSLMENMQPGERYTFVAGIVEGIAFHRYTAGGKDTAAMECVYKWFAEGHNGHPTIDVIYAAFGQYPDYPPAAVVAALANRKCGE